MISSICFNNVEVSNINSEKEKNTEPNIVVVPGLKIHVTAKINMKAMAISFLASAIIIALGVALIAAITTTAAITGGVSLIVLGLGILVISQLYQLSERIGSEKKDYQIILKEILKSEKDFSDFPKVEWEETKEKVKIKISKEQIKSYPTPDENIGFIPEEKPNYKKIPFVVCLENKCYIHVCLVDYLYKQKLKSKTFSVEVDGKEFILEDSVFNIKNFSY